MSIFFQSGLLEKDFYEYLHIIVAERAHKMFFNHELGTESENNLKIGHVTWGHRYLKYCVKCSLNFFLQAGPLLCSCMLIKNSIKNIIIILGIWSIDYWRPELVGYQFYRNAPVSFGFVKHHDSKIILSENHGGGTRRSWGDKVPSISISMKSMLNSFEQKLSLIFFFSRLS